MRGARAWRLILRGGTFRGGRRDGESEKKNRHASLSSVEKKKAPQSYVLDHIRGGRRGRGGEGVGREAVGGGRVVEGGRGEVGKGGVRASGGEWGGLGRIKWLEEKFAEGPRVGLSQALDSIGGGGGNLGNPSLGITLLRSESGLCVSWGESQRGVRVRRGPRLCLLCTPMGVKRGRVQKGWGGNRMAFQRGPKR